jgi:AraC-like DNA-binding protein
MHQLHSVWAESSDGLAQDRCARRARVRLAIKNIEDLLRKAPDSAFDLPTLARLLNLEPTHSSRVLREVTGKSYSSWIRDIRIELAKDLLLLAGCSVTAVAHAVGYVDITTFERNFRKVVGMSPMEFRKKSISRKRQ